MVAVLAACGGGGEGESEVSGPEAVDRSAPQVVDAAPDSSASPAGDESVVPDITVLSGSSTGRILYVDSRSGSDANDGLNQTQVGSGRGPWKSIAKANAAVQPGDTVRLACGSSWNETIRPAVSGTSSARVTFASYPAGCSNPAAIDGAHYLAPGAWTLHGGQVYKAALASRPLQLTSGAGPMNWAHHPNRGFDPAARESLYLRNTVDSNMVTSGSSTGSTYVTTGSDLVLPAGASIGPGTAIRIRSNAWTLDETTVASVSGSRLTLSAATTFPLKAGWGYYLAGQRWMLDSAGEWFWDANSGTLYAWMPDSRAPAASLAAAVRDVAIQLDSLSYVTVDGVAVRNTGMAVSTRYARHVTLRNMRVEDIAGVGVDGYKASTLMVSGSVFARTARDAIAAGTSTGATITGNSISQSGVLMRGGKAVSIPRRTHAGIHAGSGATITQNTVTDTGYNGIRFDIGTQAVSNTVTGTCTTLDDGAGIYTSRADNNSLIEGNVIVDVRGAPDGKPESAAASEAKGIYLDEHASGVTVRGNTVTGADHGIKLHIASGNLLSGNTLYGNRRSQIMLHEDRNAVRSTGDVFDNTIESNLVVPTQADSTGFLHQTSLVDATLFARYDLNVYLDRLFSRIGMEKAPSGTVEFDFDGWKDARLANGAPRGQDPNATAASSINYASALIGGTNIVPNGSVETALTGWSAYNDTSVKGVLSRVACERGFCVQYVAGGSSGMVSSPNFSVRKDQWYRISVDVQGSVDGQILNLVLRRGGGGTNGYEPLSSLYAYVPLSRNWTRLTYTVKVTASVVAGDPITRDKGARLDFGSIKPGQSLRIANAEIVPVTMSDSSSRTELLLNPGASSATLGCPTAASAPSLCGHFYRLGDNQPVSWPRVLGPRSSEVIFTLDRALIDSDRDGIADSQDLCPSTPAGSSVNASGCSIGQ